MRTLSIDLETYCDLDLKKLGSTNMLKKQKYYYLAMHMMMKWLML